VDGTPDNHILLINGDAKDMGRILLYTYSDNNPTTGTFEVCAAFDPVVGAAGRGRRSADLNDYIALSDTKVLITGGLDDASIPLAGNNIAVVFDAGTDAVNGAFSATGPMNTPRNSGTCVMLNNGKVLIFGGTDLNKNLVAECELYDPVTNTWTATGALHSPRSRLAYAQLNDGRVVIFGGKDGSSNVLSTIETYYPSTGVWLQTGEMLHGRNAARSALLANGDVLISGGQDGASAAIAQAETYSPLTFEVDKVSLSASSGGALNYYLTADSLNGNRNYLILGSITGTSPGSPLPGGIATLPLNWDSFTYLVLDNINSTIFSNFMGKLDGDGSGKAGFDSFGPIDPSAIGLTMSYAFALNKPWDFASNPISISIVP